MNEPRLPIYANKQQVTNSRTGKVECVFVNLEAVYPALEVEMSFEELRAQARGWLGKDWSTEKKPLRQEQEHTSNSKPLNAQETEDIALACHLQSHLTLDLTQEAHSQSNGIKEGSREGRSNRPKRTKIREVQAETQTSKWLVIPK